MATTTKKKEKTHIQVEGWDPGPGGAAAQHSQQRPATPPHRW